MNISNNSAGSASPWGWVPPLYVFQGVPSCLVMTTSAMLYKDMGISIESFAFWTSLVSLPWSFKPLWAPFVERYGTKRGWTLAMQVALAALIVALGLSLFAGSAFYAISLVVMLLVAFASASHDIACDGYYMLALSDREQSLFVGIRSTFYRVAMVAATGLVPFVAGRLGSSVSPEFGWGCAFIGAGVVLAILFLVCRRGMPRVVEPASRQDNGLSIFFRALRSFFSHPGVVPAVIFFLVYRLGEAVLAKTVTPFLIDERSAGGIGLSVDECGVVYGTFGVLSLVAGGVLGGIAASRYGLRKCLWPMMLFMNIPNVAYVLLAALQPESSSLWVSASVMVEQFGYGFGFTAYMLMLLRYVGQAEYKAAEYSIGTALMSLSLILPGALAGFLKTALGSYEALFVAAACLTVPGMVAALFINVPEEK